MPIENNERSHFKLSLESKTLGNIPPKSPTIKEFRSANGINYEDDEKGFTNEQYSE